MLCSSSLPSHLTINFLRIDFNDTDTEQTQEEIRANAEKWVQRCKRSAIVFFLVWIGWIVAAQVLRDVLPPSLYMLRNDDEALTGW